MNQEALTEAQRILTQDYACHTIILYGSYAKGDATDTSDIDMLGLSDSVNSTIRVAKKWREIYLDLFVEPPEKINSIDESNIYLLHGKVLTQRDNCASFFLEQLRKLYETTPEYLAQDELEARRVWAYKMLARAKIGDDEGNYRRIWLVTALLEDYFILRKQWYLGSKESFNWLKNNDLKTYKQFQLCLSKQHTIDAIEQLVKMVVR